MLATASLNASCETDYLCTLHFRRNRLHTITIQLYLSNDNLILINHNLLSLYALLLKELCHKIYQNSGRSRHQIQWKIKTTAQTMKTREKNNITATKYKRRHAWTYLNKIETDCSWVFGKLVSLMVFRSSFLLLLSNSQNREHLKNFRNVDCVLANHSKVQHRQANLKTTN